MNYLKPRKDQRLSVSHKHAPGQERKLAARLGGRVTPGSGNGTMKGDVRVRGKIRIECKATKNQAYKLDREVLHNIELAAASTNEDWAMQIDFVNSTGKVVRSVAVLPVDILDTWTEHDRRS